MSARGPLRVAIDATQIDNQNLGSGMFRYAADLLGGLCVQPDLRVTLFGTGTRPPEAFPQTCDYVPLPPFRGRGYYYRDLARLTWWLTRHRVDVFHQLHTNLPPVRIRPVVVTAYHYYDDPLLYATRPYRYYLWALRRRTDAVITISNATRDDLHARFAVPLERMKTVHLGLSPSLATAVPAPGPPYLLSPYNLSAPKNLQSLIAAWPAIAAAHPALELWLYGRALVTAESEAAFEAQLARLPHADRVRRLGYVDESRLAALHAGCSVFVFPTTIEGFGYPLLEAMAHGRCCVARNASAMREVGGDAVALVETLNPGEIASAVTALLDDPAARQRLGERARARASHFTVDRMVEETVGVYRAVAAGRHPSGPAIV